MAIHPTFDLPSNTSPRFDMASFGAAAGWYGNVMVRQSLQQALASLFAFGVFEKFPNLQLGILEVGSGWVGSMLDRMDAVFETSAGRAVPLKDKPSEYFKRQCFVSGDPDEHAAAYTMDYVGSDRFMWASDYPHPDHTGTWVHGPRGAGRTARRSRSRTRARLERQAHLRARIGPQLDLVAIGIAHVQPVGHAARAVEREVGVAHDLERVRRSHGREVPRPRTTRQKWSTLRPAGAPSPASMMSMIVPAETRTEGNGASPARH